MGKCNSTQLLMKIFFTHSEATWFRVHGLFGVTASELNREFSYFPQLWLLEWGCNGLKNVSKGLRDVKEGGVKRNHFEAKIKPVKVWE